MALYKVGRIWYYDFEFNGHRYKSSTRTAKKTLAQKVEDGKRRELIEGKRPIEDLLFEDLAGKYLRIHAANKRGKSFYEHNVKVLRRTFDGRLLSEITAGDVDAFMAKRRAAVRVATANRSLTVLKHMLKLAVRWGNLAASPAAEVKLEREPRGRERFLDREEAARLLAECPSWVRAIVLAALHTGARQGELLALCWEDVDLDRGLLTFRETKNGEPRTVKASETLRAVLKGLRGSKERFAGGKVFRNHGGEPIHRDGLTWSFRRAVRLAKLDGFRFHDLRHSAASFMVQAGVPLNTVREVLGHRSLGMTLRYAHLAPTHQAEAVAALDRISEGCSG